MLSGVFSPTIMQLPFASLLEHLPTHILTTHLMLPMGMLLPDTTQTLTGYTASDGMLRICMPAGWGGEVDMWAFGILVYWMLSGHTPFEASTISNIFVNIELGRWSFRGECWNSVSEDAKVRAAHDVSLDPHQSGAFSADTATTLAALHKVSRAASQLTSACWPTLPDSTSCPAEHCLSTKA